MVFAPCVSGVLSYAAGFQPSVRDFEGLKALARRQGGDAATNRGACKICGGLGHLTKQCRNFLDNGNKDSGAAGAAGAAAGDGGERQLLTADDDDALLLESDSMNSSDLGSDSGSDSDSSRVSHCDRAHWVWVDWLAGWLLLW